jgi:hypothetical protein
MASRARRRRGPITDNDSATIDFVSARSSLGEAGGSGSVGARLTIAGSGSGTPVLERPVTFSLSTFGGSALSGTDYTLPGALTFAANSLSGDTQTFAPAITDDTIVERTETAIFALSLGSDGTGGQVSVPAGAVASHTMTITDNDTATITLVSGASTVGEGAVSPVNIGLVLTITGNGVAGAGTLGQAVSVHVQDLLTGTATAGGTDYAFTSPPTLTFAAGSSSATQNATLVLNNDTIVEGTETVNLALDTLSDPTGQVALGGTLAHTVSITDNDTATLQFVAATSAAGEADGTHDVDVQLVITGNASLARARWAKP